MGRLATDNADVVTGPTDGLRVGFGPNLRAWRTSRRLSQLELSLTADISQRHLSWLETGRSKPSRNMVVQLAEALDVPLRDRNRLLESAGFAALYRESSLDDEQMSQVREALNRIITQHMPFPSLVMDRQWNVLMMNKSAEALLASVAGVDWWTKYGDGERNLALLTLHPKGLRPLISNWDEAAHAFIQRLRLDLERSTDSELRKRLEGMIALADYTPAPIPTAPLLPLLTIDLTMGAACLRLFTTLSTFGTAQDVTTDELRIESFFPVDDESEALLRTFV